MYPAPPRGHLQWPRPGLEGWTDPPSVLPLRGPALAHCVALRDVLPHRARPVATVPPQTMSPPTGMWPQQPPDMDHTQPTEDELATWRCLWDLAAKPLDTDRHLPREFVDLWQQTCFQVLRERVASPDKGPGVRLTVSDLFFVLPKLVCCPWCPPPRKAESSKERHARLKHQLPLASRENGTRDGGCLGQA